MPFRLGIARALVKLNEADRPVLRAAGLLTVDARLKERKKTGQKAARRKFQFVKALKTFSSCLPLQIFKKLKRGVVHVWPRRIYW